MTGSGGRSVAARSAGVDPKEEVGMAEHPNVAVVRNAYESFTKGDLDGALADLADDCVFHFGGDGPNSGDHKGREAITAALIKNFELTAGTQALDVKGIFADDDHAAVVLHETASRPDGASISMDEVHILRLRDGKVIDLWDVPEDVQTHDDFFSGK
jgi:uncharacterized protein